MAHTCNIKILLYLSLCFSVSSLFFMCLCLLIRFRYLRRDLGGTLSRPRVVISHKKDRKNYCIFYLLRVKVAIIGVDAFDI